MFPRDETGKKLVSAGFNVCLAVAALLLIGFSAGQRSEGADVIKECKANGLITIQGESFDCTLPRGLDRPQDQQARAP